MKKLSILFIALLVMGCVTASGPIFVEPKKYSSEKATIFVYRQVGYTHMAVCYPVRFNEYKIGCLGNGSYIIAEVVPGESKLSAALEDSFGSHSKLELPIKLAAGEKYFFKYTTQSSHRKNVESGVDRRDFNFLLTGIIPYNKGLFPVSEEIAMKELRELRKSIQQVAALRFGPAGLHRTR